jgi:Holliday junction resolvase RusA-like endonuclease
MLGRPCGRGDKMDTDKNQWSEQFVNEYIHFDIYHPLASIQNKKEIKKRLKKEIQKITSQSEYIITSNCHININYHCMVTERVKNHGAFDIDNIVKPILDSLSGNNGIIIDDSLFDRVTVNWMYFEMIEKIEIEIEYIDLLYARKDELLFCRKNNWCFPIIEQELSKISELIRLYYEIWERVNNVDQYYENVSMLPIQRFVPYNKIKDKGFKIIDFA